METALRDLPSLIRHVRDSMLSEGLAANARAINAGLCGDFASEVVSLFPEWTGWPREMVSDFDVACFIRIDPDTGFSYDNGGPFDREMLAAQWPGVVPPDGMDWDDLDRLSADAGFDACTHVFLHSDGLFYDAEAPDGIANFFELPFFQRVIRSWREDKSEKTLALA